TSASRTTPESRPSFMWTAVMCAPRSADSSSASSTMLRAIESSCMLDDAASSSPADLDGFAVFGEGGGGALSSGDRLHACARGLVALDVVFDEIAAAELEP